MEAYWLIVFTYEIIQNNFSPTDFPVCVEIKIRDSKIAGGSVAKNLPVMLEVQETWVRSLGGEDPLEKEMAAYSPWVAKNRTPPNYLAHMRDWNDVFTGTSSQAGLSAHIPPPHISSLVHCLVTRLRPTLCHPVGCSTPSSSVLHYLLEFAQIHVH